MVEVENGFRFYHAGDTNVFGDMRLIGELYRPDIALLPIGGHFTMGPREAALAVELLGVKHVMPIHYGTFPALTGTPEQFRAELDGPRARRCRDPRAGARRQLQLISDRPRGRRPSLAAAADPAVVDALRQDQVAQRVPAVDERAQAAGTRPDRSSAMPDRRSG